jgi:tRNA (guanosine-2'-O-)-methyltransferase
MQWFSGSINIEGQEFSLSEAIEVLRDKVTGERMDKLNQIIKHRSGRVVTVTESLYDRGNLSAVMRSAEAFGFYDFRIIENPEDKFKTANRASMGTDKWLKITKYRESAQAIKDLKDQGFRILTTDLDSRVSIEEVDFSVPSAIVLGNEKHGISSEMKKASDLSFKIPMVGFAQSFNISVAAALSFQVARSQLGYLFREQTILEPNSESYTTDHNLNAIELKANYLLRSVDRSQEILYHSRRSASQRPASGTTLHQISMN